MEKSKEVKTKKRYFLHYAKGKYHFVNLSLKKKGHARQNPYK